MNTFSRTDRHRIFGIGNAGIHFLDNLTISFPEITQLIGVNRDQEQMMASVIPNKIELLESLPLAESWEKVIPKIDQELEGAHSVILCGGLGGSIASRLIPMIAKKSQKAGATTLACVTYPYSFEGKRARHLATQSLEILRKICPALILIENDQLCLQQGDGGALGDTFARSDEAMEKLLPALLTLFESKSPVRISRMNFLDALRKKEARLHFGFGKSEGGNRLYEAWEQTLASPLLEKGRFLSEAEDIFLLLKAPADLSFGEAQRLMHEVEKRAQDHVDIQLGIETDPDLKGAEAPLEIILMAIQSKEEESSLNKSFSLLDEPLSEPFEESTPERSQNREELPAKRAREKTTLSSHQSLSNKVDESLHAPSLKSRLRSDELPKSASRGQARERDSSPSFKKERPTQRSFSEREEGEKRVSSTLSSSQAVPSAPSRKKEDKGGETLELPFQSSSSSGVQKKFDLDSTQRGRFDKSEPTIVEGEDLDVPTYIRGNIKI